MTDWQCTLWTAVPVQLEVAIVYCKSLPTKHTKEVKYDRLHTSAWTIFVCCLSVRCLMMMWVAKIMYILSVRAEWMSVERRCNGTYRDKTDIFGGNCPSAVLPTTDPTYTTWQSLMWCTSIEGSGSNCLYHGIAPSRFILLCSMMPYCYEKSWCWFCEGHLHCMYVGHLMFIWWCIVICHRGLLCVQWNAPNDGQRNCLKHVEFHSKSKFQKFMHLVGFIIRNLTRCTVTWTSK